MSAIHAITVSSDAPAYRTRRDSPIFVPAVREPGQMIWRRSRKGRRFRHAVMLTIALSVVALAYAVVQDARQQTFARDVLVQSMAH
ncbi:MAG: hypothetical protein V4550_10815 [Gemmatimonadota bacterium]